MQIFIKKTTLLLERVKVLLMSWSDEWLDVLIITVVSNYIMRNFYLRIFRRIAKWTISRWLKTLIGPSLIVMQCWLVCLVFIRKLEQLKDDEFHKNEFIDTTFRQFPRYRRKLFFTLCRFQNRIKVVHGFMKMNHLCFITVSVFQLFEHNRNFVFQPFTH